MQNQQHPCSHVSDAVSLSSLLDVADNPNCMECASSGPNFWLCLYEGCKYIGCSQPPFDHSTQHYKLNPNHCVQWSFVSKRLWCYKCHGEVFLEPSCKRNRIRLNSTNGPVYAFDKTVGLNVEMSGDLSDTSNENNDDEDNDNVTSGGGGGGGDLDDNDVDDDNLFRHQVRNNERTGGLVGLQNIGNTCYMNAALQALSNTTPLKRFFLECPGTVHMLADGKKPCLSMTYQTLMRDLWLKKTGGAISPAGILYGIRNVYPMFRGYYQHDTQEFLRNFMDQLHEELKQLAPLDQSCCCSTVELADASGDGDDSKRKRDEAGDTATVGLKPGRCHPSGACCEDSNKNHSTAGILKSHVSTVYDTSEGEYETCDSGVSERSSLSNDTERTQDRETVHSKGNATVLGKRKHCRVANSSRRARTKLHANYRNTLECQSCGNNRGATSSTKKMPKYRSIISDIFDGKLLSSVQCLTCDRVSSRVETFQDLSLPIPSRDHLLFLHDRNTGTNTFGSSDGSSLSYNRNTSSNSIIPVISITESWVSWILAWIKSWFYGPAITLHDCLAAFFSTDELKGDNMYSCEKCSKLRNGVKYSKVLQLPEILCIHLKRFRHELMFSSKISSFVSFPLRGLDMRPYLHADCSSSVTQYDLFSIICHYGTAGGGHYVCYALNAGQWYEFDDQYVTRVSADKVESCEAYVLFYRKSLRSIRPIHEEINKMRKHCCANSSPMAVISKQWLNRFNTCAEPGPIDNSDFLCQHGHFNPDREQYFGDISSTIPLKVYEYLWNKFGGSKAIPINESVLICSTCNDLNNRIMQEFETVQRLNHEVQLNTNIQRNYLLSMNWYRQWHKFVQQNIRSTSDSGNTLFHPPGPIDNSKVLKALTGCEKISDKEDKGGDTIDNDDEGVKITEDIWRYFHSIYGGGPEIYLDFGSEKNVAGSPDSDEDYDEKEEKTDPQREIILTNGSHNQHQTMLSEQPSSLDSRPLSEAPRPSIDGDDAETRSNSPMEVSVVNSASTLECWSVSAGGDSAALTPTESNSDVMMEQQELNPVTVNNSINKAETIRYKRRRRSKVTRSGGAYV